MNSFFIILSTALCVGAALLVYFEFIGPCLKIRKSLAQFARQDFGSPPLHAMPGRFQSTQRDIRKVAELLQRFDRQISDEGFGLRTILSSMIEGVLIIDHSQRIQLVNDALMSLLGLTESPINRPVIEIFCRHELQRALDLVLKQGTPQAIEITLETHAPSGEYQMKYFDIHIASFTPESTTHSAAALMVLHDITAIRNLEAVRREFLANVSHEFRTPLTIIDGYLETLLDGAMKDQKMLETSLRTMRKNSQRLALLIEDILTISRLEDGKKTWEFHTVNPRDLLDHVLHHLEPNIAARQAIIAIDWAPEICRIEADGKRIEQVYSNLLGNALRYGDVDALRIQITARHEESHICISFSDNGPGIPLSDQPHVFERFYCVHKDRSRDAGGTGLGLSIVKTTVEAHGGRVTLESVPGKGATFSIFLPALPNTAG